MATTYPGAPDIFDIPSAPESTPTGSAGDSSPARTHAESHRDLGDAVSATQIHVDAEVLALMAAVAAEAVLARNADNLTGGTVADARIASTIARDSEVTATVAAEAVLRAAGDALLIPLTQKGAANGVATLDSGSKVPVGQLPNSIMEYQGTWNASTNTPTLADGAGSPGDVYRVTVAGSRNLGSGSITYDVGDYVVANASTIWEKSDTTDSVPTVFGRTGNVTGQVGDYSAFYDSLGAAAAAQASAIAASQPLDATLTALAAADWAANALPIGTGANTLSQTAFAANTFPARASTGNLVAKTISDAGLDLIGAANPAAQRTTLGLGSMATQVANNVAITGGSVTALADLSSAVVKLGTNPATGGSVRMANTDFVQSRNAANNANLSVIGVDGSDQVSISASGANIIMGGWTVFGDGKNIGFGTATGTQIGYATNQKIGHWGSPPIVQPSRAGQITDNSGGTGGAGTIAVIAGAVDPTAATKASVADAIATLAARFNSLEAKLSAAGGGSGMTA